ncbi:putative Cytochrome P450, family 71, subfamily B, polypeptide 10 [Hibiscus syriacus]|uniref:Cytochrome P450, family 71, subfamily B, polypeptide 10 n=1 Tax=Hibiscus syriacus TaxID=106335 RepID=A0A6A3BMT0_HIBSY|nr:putative Cytochrome P450, family 71, subfamily B, polypeptide 10 [Hibiscus syriacus]
MLLHLGRIPVFIVSSADVAKEVMKVNDLACCSRPKLAGIGKLTYNYLDVAFSPYSECWREMRKITVLEIFSTKRVKSFRFIREDEVGSLMDSMSPPLTDPVNLTEKVFALSGSIIFRTAFGKCFHGSEFDRAKFYELVHDVETVAGAFSYDEWFPGFGWIIDWISGHNGRVERVSMSWMRFSTEHVLGRRRHQRADCDLGNGGTCEKSNTDEESTRRSSRRHGNKGRVPEADLDQLQYLKMIIKETLRLHPPAPMLIAREAISHFKINGYDIHPKTLIQVNAWALARDPKNWKNPEEFSPDRFIDNAMDFKGQSFQLLPFGSGRRGCPRIYMGTVTSELLLANLLYCFDWALPAGTKQMDVNMEEQIGQCLTLNKKTPLLLVPIKYLHAQAS